MSGHETHAYPITTFV